MCWCLWSDVLCCTVSLKILNMKQMLLSFSKTNTDRSRIPLSKISIEETLRLCCMLLRSVYLQKCFLPTSGAYVHSLMYNAFSGFCGWIGVFRLQHMLWIIMKRNTPFTVHRYRFLSNSPIKSASVFMRRPLYFTAWPIVCVLAAGQSVWEWFAAQAGEAVKGSLINQSMWVCHEE